MAIVKGILGTIKEAVFPNICVCGKWGEPVCEKCKGLVKVNKTQLCPVCRKISEHGKTCKTCSSKSYLTGVLILGRHEGQLKRLIWRYKYEFIRDLHTYFAELFYTNYASFARKKKFLVTYVPISKERRNWRGFNQSELIANQFGKLAELEVRALLNRKNAAQSQVGLSKREREENLRNSIEAIGEVQSRRILIVDDVITTGSTLEECAHALRKAGAREVWALVLSRD